MVKSRAPRGSKTPERFSIKLGPHMQIHVALRWRGWSRRTRDLSCCGFLVELFAARSELRNVLFLAPSVCGLKNLSNIMKYLENRWTDLRQIHIEDALGSSLGRVWRSKSKIKVTRDKNAFSAPSVAYARFTFGKTSLASSYGRPMEKNCPVVSSSFFLISFFFFPSPNLSGRRLHVYHTSTNGVALVRIYNAGLKCAPSWKYRKQKWRKKSPSAHHRTTLSGCVFATEACIDNRKKTC